VKSKTKAWIESTCPDVFLCIAIVSLVDLGYAEYPKIVNPAVMFMAVGYFAWSLRSGYIKRLGLEKRTRRCIQAMDGFKRMMLDHIIPEIESHRKGDSQLEAAEEEEIKKILWDVYGVDWWGADYFWLEHHLFRLDKECSLSASPKFSAKRLCSQAVLEDMPQLRELLRQRLAIMNKTEFGKADCQSPTRKRVGLEKPLT